MKIVELLENVRQWKEHPVVKIDYLFKLFTITNDDNVKAIIVDEVLEDVDAAMSEFPTENSTNEYLQQIKTILMAYKNG